ncbi:MAG TPA: anaerobic ribonucleoside-triphosphate reductase activating protein [Spirochaetota bacterium]
MIFTGGCNLRCRFCHNTELAFDSGGDTGVCETEILATLEKRKKLIDAVVISGGEPTLRTGLLPFIQKVKALGFKVKIDTNGFAPQIIEELLNRSLLDYAAIDIKTSPSKYHTLTGSKDTDLVHQTLSLLKAKAPDYEVRTTCVPGYVEMEDLIEISEWIGKVKKYYLQQFRNDNTLDQSLSSCMPHSKEKLFSFRDFVSSFAETCDVRGI